VVEQPSSLAPVACGEVSDELEELKDDDGVCDGVLGVLLEDDAAGGGVEELEEDVLAAAETFGALPPPQAVIPNRVRAPAEATAKRVSGVCMTTLFR